MRLGEFLFLSEYDAQLKADKENGWAKNAEFNSLVPLVLGNIDENIMVRDRLDDDGTFSVLFDDTTWTLHDAIKAYFDVADIVSYTTYTKVKDYGLISLEYKTGFWVLFE